SVPAVPPAKPKAHTTHKTRRTTHNTAVRRAAKPKPLDTRTIQGRVTALVVAGNTWYAATAHGVFRSSNDGETWDGPILGAPPAEGLSSGETYTAMAVAGNTLIAARRDGLMVSTNQGATWEPVIFPAGLTAVDVLTATPDASVWAGGRE